jgi:hypothetical protein
MHNRKGIFAHDVLAEKSRNTIGNGWNHKEKGLSVRRTDINARGNRQCKWFVE